MVFISVYFSMWMAAVQGSDMWATRMPNMERIQGEEGEMWVMRDEGRQWNGQTNRIEWAFGWWAVKVHCDQFIYGVKGKEGRGGVERECMRRGNGTEGTTQSLSIPM